ncbi:MAG: ArsR family transcriptional regulator [Candidatus Woesearchaeota archaeon]|nr:MAG: ArsR family transcriptional regulator [Candidatus Woesearchaeota archaeon]
MEEDKVLLDRKTLKAIVSESRMDILKLLSAKQYTQTDIADLLGLGASTVKEHLDTLEKADLVKKEVTTRKWKYYSLTLKGKRLVDPRSVRVLFAFGISLVATIGVGVTLAKQLFLKSTLAIVSAEARAAPMMANDAVTGTLEAAAPQAMQAGAQEFAKASVSETIQGAVGADPSGILVLVFLLFVVISAFLAGNMVRKKPIIVRKK